MYDMYPWNGASAPKAPKAPEAPPAPVAPGESSAPQSTVAASDNTAYVVLAPGWDPASSAEPSCLVVLQSRQGYGVQRAQREWHGRFRPADSLRHRSHASQRRRGGQSLRSVLQRHHRQGHAGNAGLSSRRRPRSLRTFEQRPRPERKPTLTTTKVARGAHYSPPWSTCLLTGTRAIRGLGSRKFAWLGGI